MTHPHRPRPLLVLLLAAAAPATLGAATITVPDQAPSIAAAMDAARAGDFILVGRGVYREHDIVVTPGVTLLSSDSNPASVIIDAEGQGRCLILWNCGNRTVISGVTLRGGRVSGPGAAGQGGAILAQDSAAVFRNCIVTGNRAEAGGGLATRGERGPTFEACVLRDNEADGNGGGVLWTASGDGRLERCVLRSNHALQAGGGLAGRGGRLLVQDCLLTENTAGMAGGACDVAATALVIRGSVLRHNTGGIIGGAVHVRNASPRLENCTFHGNDADGDGTVFGLASASPTVVACLITGSRGDLLEAIDGQLALERTNIFVGASSWPGPLAGLRNLAGNLAIDPRYCDADAGDLHLRRDSPCLAPARGRIGALGAGCGAQFPPDVVE